MLSKAFCMTQCMLNYTQIKLLPLLNEDYVFASVYLHNRLYACEQPQFKNFVFYTKSSPLSNYSRKNLLNVWGRCSKNVAVANIFGIFQGKTLKSLHLHFCFTCGVGTGTIGKFSVSSMITFQGHS